MIALLHEALSYTFMTRALAAGLCVALAAALVGVSLVLKNYAMLGDGLSHVGFGALAVASALGAAPLMIALPVTVAAAFLLLRFGAPARVRGDASVAMVSTASLAVGVLVVSLSGTGADLNNYLFGSILTLTATDTMTAIALSCAVVLCYILFYNRIFAVTFDDEFARASGINTGASGALLAALAAATVVVGMRLMGALLITALLVFPPLSAMRVCKTYRATVICSAVVAVICFAGGLFSSYALSLPTGAAIVATSAVAYAIFAALTVH